MGTNSQTTNVGKSFEQSIVQTCYRLIDTCIYLHEHYSIDVYMLASIFISLIQTSIEVHRICIKCHFCLEAELKRLLIRMHIFFISANTEDSNHCPVNAHACVRALANCSPLLRRHHFPEQKVAQIENNGLGRWLNAKTVRTICNSNLPYWVYIQKYLE